MKKTLIILLSVFTCSILSAQEYYDDARVWTNLYIEKTFKKNFNIHLNQKNRFDNNVQRFELGYADMGITVKPLKSRNFKFLVDYVYAQKHTKNDNWIPKHTFYVAAVFRKDFRRFRIMYRNLAQATLHAPHTSKTSYLPVYYDRNKLTVKYEATKRLEFYVAEELYIPFFVPQTISLTRSRAFAGMFINVTRHQVLELYFSLQQELAPTDFYKQKSSYRNLPPGRDFIYGIGYSFLF